MKEIVSEYGAAKYEHPIVSFTFKDGLELGFPEMYELIAQAEELSERKPYVVLCDLRVNMKVTREGKRTVANKRDVPFKRATALLVNPDKLNQEVNYFSEVKGTDYPYKVFTDKEAAIHWLKQIPVEK